MVSLLYNWTLPVDTSTREMVRQGFRERSGVLSPDMVGDLMRTVCTCVSVSEYWC